jgi:hypothetical protein
MIPAEIMTFLRTRAERYCAACVALELGGTPEETRSILDGLHRHGAVLVGTEACHGCGRTVETFARSTSGRPWAW